MATKNILDTFLKNVTRKKSVFKKIATYLIVFLAILILGYGIIYRKQIFFSIGNLAFGGTIYGHHVYHLGLAEASFKLADLSGNQKIQWLNYQLSRVNFIQGELPVALYYANKELEYFPENCRTRYIRGLTYAYMDRLDAAISDFERFNTCFPGTWAGHNDLAWFWFRKGDMQKVVEVLEPLASTYITNAWVQNTYGAALMNLKRYKEAEKALLYAKSAASEMTEERWGKSYPGNDPRVYRKGLDAMRSSIDANLKIIQDEKQKQK